MNDLERISLEKFLTVLMDERDKRYEQRFIAQEKASQSAFDAAEEALAKSDAVSIRDKASANEWREAMNDREKNFLSKSEYSVQHQSLVDKVEVLSGTRASGLSSAWGYFVGILGLILAGLAVYYHR